MQKNAEAKRLSWLGKTNSQSKNSTPTGRCQAETGKFAEVNFSVQETICILNPAKPLTFLPERSILAAGIVVPALPYLLSFAAGAMLYVVVEELIPEMSQGQHSNVGTVFFAVGFSVMMVLDVALG